MSHKDQLTELLISLQRIQSNLKELSDSDIAIQFLTYTINNLKVSIKHTSIPCVFLIHGGFAPKGINLTPLPRRHSWHSHLSTHPITNWFCPVVLPSNKPLVLVSSFGQNPRIPTSRYVVVTRFVVSIDSAVCWLALCQPANPMGLRP